MNQLSVSASHDPFQYYYILGEFFEYQSLNILKSMLLLLIDSDVKDLSISLVSFLVASDLIWLQLSLTFSPILYEHWQTRLVVHSSTATELRNSYLNSFLIYLGKIGSV